MLRRVWSDNPWIPPLFAAAGVAATFIGLGWQWALGLAGLIAVAVIFALWFSLKHATQEQSEPDADYVEAAGREPDQSRKLSESERSEERSNDEPAELDSGGGGAESSDDFELPVHVRIWIAAREGDLANVKELSDPWVAEVDGDVQRTVSRRAFQLQMLAEAGHSTALSELHALADEHRRESAPVLNLAQLFENLGEPRSGATTIRERLEQIAAEDQPELVAKEAELWRKAGEPLKAVEATTQALGSLEPNIDNKAKLLAQRGLALYEANRHSLAFVDLEQSLELNPGDTDLRFKLAWRYSEKGWETVAAAHYKILGQDPKPMATAMNNLGWSYERLGLGGMAANTYLRAIDLGSARAAGNYALLALGADLLDQVRGHIDRGMELDRTDDQVARAIAGLADKESTEERKLEQLEEIARDGRRIVAALSASEGIPPTGRWILVPGGIVDFDGDEYGFVEGTNDQTKVTVFPADDVSPMMMRWIDGDLSGFEGPVRVQGDLMEGVLVEPKSGEVRTIRAQRWATPTAEVVTE